MNGKGTLFMPELPEVEVLKRDLIQKMPKPARIVRIQLLAPKLRTKLVLPKKIHAQSIAIKSITRRSKFLIFETTVGFLISHLGMSGRWRIDKYKKILKHDHVVLEWENGDFWVYNDPRRFGLFEYYKSISEVKWFKSLGPEPFSEQFHTTEMIKKIKSTQRSIKSVIMDSKVMVGVGNIYASEALFKAKINPFKLGSKVSAKKVTELLTVIQTTLQSAIEGGGSSIRDYVHSDGEKGNFQNQHLVYARDGEPCMDCGSKIKVKKIQGRSTFWCVKCQS